MTTSTPQAAPATPDPFDAIANAAIEQAAELTAAGQGEKARAHLEETVMATGHPLAMLFLADFLHTGVGGERDPRRALAFLRRSAEGGNARAASLYAAALVGDVDGPRDFETALDWLIMGASLGDPAAMSEVALMLPVNGGPINDSIAKQRRVLIEVAALRGDPVGAWLLHQSRLKSTDRAIRADADVWLFYAARIGHPHAQRMLKRRLIPAPDRVIAPVDQLAKINWETVRENLVLPHQRPLPAAAVELAEPRVRSLRALLSEEECDYLAAKGAPHLDRAMVGQGVIHDARSNDSATFQLFHSSVIAQSLDTRIAMVLGLPPENGERMVLLRYRPGQAYAPHFDWLDPKDARDAANIAARGQRVATLIVYLNTDFTGGETQFVRTNAAFRGNRGDALMWDNLLADGTIDESTEHAGLTPKSGEKFLLSKWMRDRSQTGLQP